MVRTRLDGRSGRLIALVAIGVGVTMTTGDAGAQAVPRPTWRKLVSSNGYAPVVFDLEARRINGFRENLYRYPGPGQETRELAYDLYLGLRAEGQSRWMTEVAVDEAGYELGTGIIRTVQRVGGLRLTTRYFAPFTLDARAFVVVAELENLGAEVRDVALFTLHNFHVGGGPDGHAEERIVWDPSLSAYVERSSHPDAARGALVVKPLSAPDGRTAGNDNPFVLLNRNQRFGTVEDTGAMSDAVSGFEHDVAQRGAFAPGQVARFAWVVGWVPGGDVALFGRQVDAALGGRSPEAILEAERADWTAWHASGLWPDGASEEELAIARQSLAVLRMGQVREPGAPNGQLLASLPPGMWDIAWVRDGLLAVRALIATGHLAEARAAMDFYLRGPHGEYASYVGRSYGLSVARHYGNGREESDWNQNGPNVELDGFGMFLEAANELVAAGETAWFTANRARIDEGVADVLLHFRDPETGLIAAESSIWESHWDNGGRQRWVYTSGYAVIGLRAWADTLEAAGVEPTRVADDRAAADGILAGMRRHLVDSGTGALASSVEQLRRGDGRIADAQAALILSPRSIAPGDPTGLATLDLLRQRLFLSATTRRGYKRNDDGDLYDEREWVVIDLGISRALRVAGRTTEADALLDWVTGQARENFRLISELYDQTDGRYAGEVPMIGFGAGAYLLALVERSGTRPGRPGDRPDAGVGPDGGLDAGATTDAAEDGGARPDAGMGADTGAEPDAAVGADAGSESDGGIAADAATRPSRPGGSAPTVDRDGDCGCRAGAPPANGTPRSERGGVPTEALGLIALGLVARRRRGRAAPARRIR